MECWKDEEEELGKRSYEGSAGKMRGGREGEEKPTRGVEGRDQSAGKRKGWR